VGQLKLRKPKNLEELAPPDREVCQVLVSLGAVFNMAQLIKHEYDAEALMGYIGIGLFFLLHFHCVCLLSLYMLVYSALLSSHFFLSWCKHGAE